MIENISSLVKENMHLSNQVYDQFWENMTAASNNPNNFMQMEHVGDKQCS
jgi:hypothetical protein